jgi:hypothetical protein
LKPGSAEFYLLNFPTRRSGPDGVSGGKVFAFAQRVHLFPLVSGSCGSALLPLLDDRAANKSVALAFFVVLVFINVE